MDRPQTLRTCCDEMITPIHHRPQPQINVKDICQVNGDEINMIATNSCSKISERYQVLPKCLSSWPGLFGVRTCGSAVERNFLECHQCIVHIFLVEREGASTKALVNITCRPGRHVQIERDDKERNRVHRMVVREPSGCDFAQGSNDRISPSAPVCVSVTYLRSLLLLGFRRSKLRSPRHKPTAV